MPFLNISYIIKIKHGGYLPIGTSATPSIGASHLKVILLVFLLMLYLVMKISRNYF